MAFDLNTVGGLGASATEVTATADMTINDYGEVVNLSATQVTLGETTGTFSAGDEILFHVSAATTDQRYSGLGKWAICKVTSVSGKVLTVDADLTKVWSRVDTSHCQVVKVATYGAFTIPSDVTISPPAFNGKYGGILVLKCAGTFTLAGKVDLVDKGLPSASIRPLTYQEESGTRDVDFHAGWENGEMPYRMPLNVGDGMMILFAKRFTYQSGGRIGNPAVTGRQFCRGASDSPFKPEGVTNIGGSTIFIAAETFTNTSYVGWISKYRDATRSPGKGLARCYLATSSRLVNDEGLYSADLLSEPARLKSQCNISDFGDGSNGSSTIILNTAVNVYAKVTSLKGKVLEYTDKTKAGTFPVDSLVMIHFSQKTATDTTWAGRLWLAHVKEDDGYQITLDAAPPAISLTNYTAQIILVPQYENVRLKGFQTGVPKFDGSKGGIFAIAVKDTCDLSTGGGVNVEGKGGAPAYGTPLLKQGNVHMATRLPLGSGHGSVFILAKKLKVDSSTRLGATYSGATLGGRTFDNIGGGFLGAVSPATTTDSRYRTATGGSPAGAGVGQLINRGEVEDSVQGGYGSNATGTNGGLQGAHLFIVAETIEGFTMHAFSTGGAGGTNTYSAGSGQSGGAGYGGGGGHFNNTHDQAAAGGYLAGGGGFAAGGGTGFAFIYCNNAPQQATSDIITDY